MSSILSHNLPRMAPRTAAIAPRTFRCFPGARAGPSCPSNSCQELVPARASSCQLVMSSSCTSSVPVALRVGMDASRVRNQEQGVLGYLSVRADRTEANNDGISLISQMQLFQRDLRSNTRYSISHKCQPPRLPDSPTPQLTQPLPNFFNGSLFFLPLPRFVDLPLNLLRLP